MKAFQTDIINIIFILVSIVLALFLPFELFLFSYAFLGPLHYLTEINWLNNKNYFSKSKFPIYFIIVLIVLIGSLSLSSHFELLEFSLKSNLSITLTTYFILISFLFLIFTEFFKDKLKTVKYQTLLVLVISVALSTLILENYYFAYVVIFVFLPTLIHVFVFTFMFMWFGYLKKPNALALLSVLLMLIIPIATMLIPGQFLLETTSTLGLETYKELSFTSLNKTLSKFLDSNLELESMLYESANGLKIQSFIAFAYTYHYLNWFAKINIIGWSKSLSKTRLITIFLLWLLAIGLYIYDFKLGLIILFFMSLGHVLLEFPLNIQVMKGIYKHYQLKVFKTL